MTHPGGSGRGEVGVRRERLGSTGWILRKQTEIKLYEVRMGKIGQSPTHQLNAQLYSQSET